MYTMDDSVVIGIVSLTLVRCDLRILHVSTHSLNTLTQSCYVRNSKNLCLYRTIKQETVRYINPIIWLINNTNVFMLCQEIINYWIETYRSERETKLPHLQGPLVPIPIYTSGVLEHKWRVSLIGNIKLSIALA